MRKLKVAIVKSSPWRLWHLSRDHPEYSATFSLIRRFESKIQFILLGSDNERTRQLYIRNAIVWDIRIGRLLNSLYYVSLFMTLLKYRPNHVIVLGHDKVLPVSMYALFNKKSTYTPFFIGEFGYYGRLSIGQPLMKLFFKILGISLKLSRGRIARGYAISKAERRAIRNLAPSLMGRIDLYSYPISSAFTGRLLSVTPNYSGSGVPKILTVAGIEPRKGLDTLLKALRLIGNDCELLIKGAIRDARYMEMLLEMVRDFHLESKVSFITERIDYPSLASYYKSATIFVFPTREDSLGVVVLEALHCGLPVISTAVGGVPDMIQNGVNGILIPPDKPDVLAHAISCLLSEEETRTSLAKNARRVLLSRYYKDRVTIKEAMHQSVEEALSCLN